MVLCYTRHFMYRTTITLAGKGSYTKQASEHGCSFYAVSCADRVILRS